MSEYFSFSRVLEYFPKIIVSFPITLLIVFFSIVLGTFFGITLAYIRIQKIPILSQLAVIFISFIRGTPEIIQLFLVYYGLPRLFQSLFGIDLSRLDAIYFVLVAYGLNESAYLAEIFRGGLKSISVGQYEAGYTTGLTKKQTFWNIVLPQTFKIVFPSIAVSIIVLFQNTSMAASIGVQDLMGRAGLMGSTTRHYTESYFIVSVIFVIVSILLELLFNKLNKFIDYDKRGEKKV